MAAHAGDETLTVMPRLIEGPGYWLAGSPEESSLGIGVIAKDADTVRVEYLRWRGKFLGWLEK